SPRAAKVLSRSIIALAAVLAVTSVVGSAAAARHPISAPLIVGDPSLADGPAVLAYIQTGGAAGREHGATGVHIGHTIRIDDRRVRAARCLARHRACDPRSV